MRHRHTEDPVPIRAYPPPPRSGTLVWHGYRSFTCRPLFQSPITVEQGVDPHVNRQVRIEVPNNRGVDHNVLDAGNGVGGHLEQHQRPLPVRMEFRADAEQGGSRHRRPGACQRLRLRRQLLLPGRFQRRPRGERRRLVPVRAVESPLQPRQDDGHAPGPGPHLRRAAHRRARIRSRRRLLPDGNTAAASASTSRFRASPISASTSGCATRMDTTT